MLNTLIVGYGFAGKHLHHRCLSKMIGLGWESRLDPQIVAVDTAATLAENPDQPVLLLAAIPAVAGHESSRWVVHICTPPEHHFADICTALEQGYRQILVEKPAASTLEQLHELITLEQHYRASILVVANWVSSPAVATLVSLLNSQQYGALSQIRVVQNKSRFMRSRSRSGEHVFDIEMPHQVALALYLGGPAQLYSAQVTDMVMPDLTLANLGIGNLVLHHANGITSNLCSSLIHTARERYVELTTASGYRLKACFPAGGDDSYSRVLITSPQGELQSNTLLFDDPLTHCFIRAYHYFLQNQRAPGSQRPAGMDLAFNAQKVSLLAQAKQRAAAQPQAGDLTRETVTDNGVV